MALPQMEMEIRATAADETCGKVAGKGRRVEHYIRETCKSRIMFIDGAMGTMIQKYRFIILR